MNHYSGTSCISISLLEYIGSKIKFSFLSENLTKYDEPFSPFPLKPWIGYTYIDRKNKVCDNVKNTLRRMNICLIEEKEEPIPKNLSNRWLIYINQENHE